jgi:uncharacterized membrane protein
MKARTFSPLEQVAGLFLVATVVSAGFFFVGALRNNSMEFWYLLWNLVLAWVPFGLSLWLRQLLRTRHWASWLPLIITVIWLGFLPNTFYMLTDYIHLQEVPRVDQIYDVAMFTSLIATGVSLGFASLAIVHVELRRRLPIASAWRVVALILLLTSFAIYVGRDLRWNTWDIITSPAGILFDISERIINPTAHGQTFTTTITYFVLLGLCYYCLWRVASLVRHAR